MAMDPEINGDERLTNILRKAIDVLQGASSQRRPDGEFQKSIKIEDVAYAVGLLESILELYRPDDMPAPHPPSKQPFYKRILE